MGRYSPETKESLYRETIVKLLTEIKDSLRQGGSVPGLSVMLEQCRGEKGWYSLPGLSKSVREEEAVERLLEMGYVDDR